MDWLQALLAMAYIPSVDLPLERVELERVKLERVESDWARRRRMQFNKFSLKYEIQI